MEALDDANSDVCSIYSSTYASNVHPAINRLTAGNAVFTFPVTPVKCAGAAQKICYIAEEIATQVAVTSAQSINEFIEPTCKTTYIE